MDKIPFFKWIDTADEVPPVNRPFIALWNDLDTGGNYYYQSIVIITPHDSEGEEDRYSIRDHKGNIRENHNYRWLKNNLDYWFPIPIIPECYQVGPEFEDVGSKLT